MQIPKDWKLVPSTPTEEMLRAGYWSGAGDVRFHEEWARRESYERMVANAPECADLAAAQEEIARLRAALATCRAWGAEDVDGDTYRRYSFDEKLVREALK